MVKEFDKNEPLTKMAENVKVLRNKLGLTQDELAGKIGISRQTLVSIENKKREMSWNTFVALITVFRADNSTSNLFDYFGIYSPEFSRYLVSRENINPD